MVTRDFRLLIVIACFLITLTSAGCGPCARMFHMTAISFFPHKKSALCPPEPTPHFANPQFFGHYGTCWHEWPEGWVDCPCDIVYEDAMPEHLMDESLPQHSQQGEEIIPEVDDTTPGLEESTPQVPELPSESTPQVPELPSESTVPMELEPAELPENEAEAPGELEAPPTLNETGDSEGEAEPEAPRSGRRRTNPVKPARFSVTPQFGATQFEGPQAFERAEQPYEELASRPLPVRQNNDRRAAFSSNDDVTRREITPKPQPSIVTATTIPAKPTRAQVVEPQTSVPPSLAERKAVAPATLGEETDEPKETRSDEPAKSDDLSPPDLAELGL